ncbi:MAG: BtrH N-terminal domain-containing protein [Chloroflexota bacterium]
MTPKPFAGFKTFQAHHCVTGSLRHIYEFNHFSVSEDLLIGLGAGVGFIYWHTKGTAPFYGGRANVGRAGEEGLEVTASRRLGVRAETYKTNSPHRAEKALVEMLTAGTPVMLLVDMGFLPYLDLPEDYHFGAHAITVAGYDAETNQVLVADRDEGLYTISMDVLAQARDSRYRPFPPKHQWYTFDFSGMHPPEADDVWQAIHEVVVGMMEPPITNIGVKGIRKAARSTLKWPETMNEKELRWACFNAYVFIDAIGGTGGGIFRYMYSRFLREASEIVGDQRLLEVSDDLRVIGDGWQEVAQMFKRAVKRLHPEDLLPDITAPILSIADQEQAAWERLGELIS